MNKTPHNKIDVPIEKIKKIRKMFFIKDKMSKIEKSTKLTERVIRRIIKENNFLEKRERYYRYILFVNNNKTIKELSNCSNIKENILYNYKRKFKIKSSFINIPANKKITKNIEQDFIKLYNTGMSCSKIAISFGFKTPKTVSDVLHKNNINLKTNSDYTNYNKKYFRDINSVAKEYILGLLFADGYVIKDYEGIGIQLSTVDRDILEKIAKQLGPSSSIINIKSRGSVIIMDRIVNTNDMCRLSIHCPQISLDLKNYGLLRNKTHILKFPFQLKRLNHFVRGIMDGDGTIGFHSKNNFPWSRFSTASRCFAEGFCKAMMGHGFEFRISGNKFFNCYQVGGRDRIIEFYRWLYRRKDVWYLERKYAKVQDKIN